MKKNILLLLLIIVAFHSNAQWVLIWHDEFNGTEIDPANWSFETGTGYNGWGNNEMQYYTYHKDNATISNGNLLIIAKKESLGGSNYTSARMNTKGLHSWTYGKIEARIRLPLGPGTWPAFWMLGQNIDTAGWPNCGETDIMEHVNNDAKIYGTMHWDNNGHAQYGGDTLCNVSLYHIYAVEWDQHTIKWLLDGSKFREGNIAGNINSTEEFHSPFYILLNLAIGGNWPGPPNGATVFPDTMFVDYVRVYKQTSGITDRMSVPNIMNVFPNPGTGNIIIEIAQQAAPKAGIDIFDVHGRLLKSVTTNSKTTYMDISAFSAGIYFIKVKTGKEIVIKKFIKL